MENRSRKIEIGTAAVIAALAVFLLTAALLFTTLGVASLLPASILGASVLPMIFSYRSTMVTICYVAPTAAVYFGLPMVVAAMSDGHPGKVMLWQWVSIAHVLVSILVLELVRVMPSTRARLMIPAAVIASTAVVAYAMTSADHRHWKELMDRTEPSVGRAFERDVLPRLLAKPGKVTWSEPIGFNDQTSALAKYRVDGVFDRNRFVRLNGFGAYSVSFTVKIPAGDFQIGDPKDRAGRLKRAKEWLRAAGVSHEQFENLKIEVPDHWDTGLSNSGRIVSISPGQREVSIEGIAEYDPITRRFLD